MEDGLAHGREPGVPGSCPLCACSRGNSYRRGGGREAGGPTFLASTVFKASRCRSGCSACSWQSLPQTPGDMTDAGVPRPDLDHCPLPGPGPHLAKPCGIQDVHSVRLPAPMTLFPPTKLPMKHLCPAGVQEGQGGPVCCQWSRLGDDLLRNEGQERQAGGHL